MKIKNITLGLFTLFIVSIVGVGASFAHGSDNVNRNTFGSTNFENRDMLNQGRGFQNNMYQNFGRNNMMRSNDFSNMGRNEIGFEEMGDIHSEMNDVINEGNYDKLQNFRTKYSMPAMIFVQNDEDMKDLKENNFQMGFNNENSFSQNMGYRSMYRFMR